MEPFHGHFFTGSPKCMDGKNKFIRQRTGAISAYTSDYSDCEQKLTLGSIPEITRSNK